MPASGGSVLHRCPQIRRISAEMRYSAAKDLQRKPHPRDQASCATLSSAGGVVRPSQISVSGKPKSQAPACCASKGSSKSTLDTRPCSNLRTWTGEQQRACCSVESQGLLKAEADPHSLMMSARPIRRRRADNRNSGVPSATTPYGGYAAKSCCSVSGGRGQITPAWLRPNMNRSCWGLAQGPGEGKGHETASHLFRPPLRVWTPRHPVCAAHARQTSGFLVSGLSIASRRHDRGTGAGLSDTASLVAGSATGLELMFADAKCDHAFAEDCERAACEC